MIAKRTLCLVSGLILTVLAFGCGGDGGKSVQPQNSEPTACFTVSPMIGTTDTDFEVDASCSTDPEDSVTVLDARWDWDDDGSWDTSFGTNKIATYRYDTPGAKTIRVEVADAGGKTGIGERAVSVLPGSSGFVLIPAGGYVIGSPTGEAEWNGDETQESVAITYSFRVARHEVTQFEWNALMGWNHSQFEGDNLPVDHVTWFDCAEFCNRRSALDGLTPAYIFRDKVYDDVHIVDAHVTWDEDATGYRLPTEAEWEYACRAGQSAAFATGAMTQPGCTPADPNLSQVGWYCGNADVTTHPVQSKAPNAWGLYDMHGNVQEWCWDWYGSYYEGPLTDPTGPIWGTYRMARGGNWSSEATDCRSARRGMAEPQTSGKIGMRLVRTAS